MFAPSSFLSDKFLNLSKSDYPALYSFAGVRMLTIGGISNSSPTNYEWTLDIEVVVMSKNEVGQPGQ
jgi:hypothetical protein